MLRAVIKGNGKKAYIDFCGSWEKLETAIRRFSTVEYISSLSVKNNDFKLYISKVSSNIFEKLNSLISEEADIYDIYFLCKKLQYDDINFEQVFLEDSTCNSIKELRAFYIKYADEKHKEKTIKQTLSSIKNPTELHYEPLKLFGRKVLFTDWRIDKSQLPPNLYAYDVREDHGDISGIGKGILFNHYGTILSDKPIKLKYDDYRDINEAKDIIYSEEPNISLKQYIQESKFIHTHFHQR